SAHRARDRAGSCGAARASCANDGRSGSIHGSYGSSAEISLATKRPSITSGVIDPQRRRQQGRARNGQDGRLRQTSGRSANPMTNASEIVDRYLAAWNEGDGRRRRDLIGEIFAEKAIYRDPALAGTGRDGIDRMIAGAQARF